MATLTLGSDTYEVAPFHLDKLEAAADDIDAVQAAVANMAAAGGSVTWKTLLSAYRPVLRIAALGLAPGGPSADDLMAKAGFTDDKAIFGFFNQVLVESGLRQLGEDQAPAKDASAAESLTPNANPSADNSGQ